MIPYDRERLVTISRLLDIAMYEANKIKDEEILRVIKLGLVHAITAVDLQWLKDD